MMHPHGPERMRLALTLAVCVAVVLAGVLWLAFHRGDRVVPLPPPTSIGPVPTVPPPSVTVTAPNFDPTAPTAPTVVSTTQPGEVVVVVTTAVRNP